jgi:hypothetical protein
LLTASAIRQFPGGTPVITAHNVPKEQVRTALLYAGLGLGPDVMGRGFDQFPSKLRDKIVTTYPRNTLKEEFNHAYIAGFRLTSFGSLPSDGQSGN